MRNNWIELEKELVAENEHYPVSVYEGKRGLWRVARVQVCGNGLQNLRYIRDGIPECVVSPGEYVGLFNEDGLVMSNTQLEYRTSRAFVARANGRVLVSGLGLGMLIRPLLARSEVTSLTVLEIERDVIALVAPFYADCEPRLNIVHADALSWSAARGERFDCAFHDIWPSFGPGYLDKYRSIKLHHRRWAKRQECWPEAISTRMHRLEKRFG